MRKLAMAIVLAASASTQAYAAEIVGLYNTGVKNCASGDPCSGVGNGQKGGNGADLHWDLAGDPQAFTRGPHPAWISESGSNTASRWITPQSGIDSVDPTADGFYTYLLTFNIGSAFNPATASFLGRFAADNQVTSILLNSTQLLAAPAGTFNSWTAFGANSGFVTGNNVLSFTVRNFAQASGNPTGLRVEFTQNAISAVPEPATWAMMILGFGLIGSAMRARVRPTTSFRFA